MLTKPIIDHYKSELHKLGGDIWATDNARKLHTIACNLLKALEQYELPPSRQRPTLPSLSQADNPTTASWINEWSRDRAELDTIHRTHHREVKGLKDQLDQAFETVSRLRHREQLLAEAYEREGTLIQRLKSKIKRLRTKLKKGS